MQGSWRLKIRSTNSGTNRFLAYPKSKWCGWVTPALFLASGQRASGVHERPEEGELSRLSFFCII
ncbi:hypothetical protein SSM2_190 [Synechococcus phage S-SM2]|uniref:Uncharacterized protein n=1 Tax=Synechococcus phage S-SM2 TaxID=444860 RepID=E3SJ75_9CAUD|nr:hypothetical protein SSM2_190 [Synechococcus phage S-SM2]ADO97523.1 hypothetical protein SSM2_190 [Synechococcus phage S-SM2]